MRAKRARGGRTPDDDFCARPTEPVPMRIPPEAYRSIRPPGDAHELANVPPAGGFESGTLPRSIHEAQTIPPPASSAHAAASYAADAAPLTVGSPGASQASDDALSEIDEAWD
jgi:hypothetical protein